jgi:hypothetical protein
MQWLRRMDKNSLHITRTLTCIGVIVRSFLKVVGGMQSVTVPTWMDCIWKETIKLKNCFMIIIDLLIFNILFGSSLLYISRSNDNPSIVSSLLHLHMTYGFLPNTIHSGFYDFDIWHFSYFFCFCFVLCFHFIISLLLKTVLFCNARMILL